MTRTLLQALHRYVGLWCGLIFMVLGLTGMPLAWMHELDRALNPDLLTASTRPAARAVPASAPTPVAPHTVDALVQRLSADPRYGRPSQVMLPETAEDVFVVWYRPEARRGGDWLAQDISRQVMVDPASLRILGERNWGELGLTRRLLMPTLFIVHRYLAAGEVGKIVIGVSGLLLLLISFSGLVLWWPKFNRKAWAQALRVSYKGSWPRWHFTMHRTAGFFIAPILIVQGFSGLYFNLPHWVLPVVGSVMPLASPSKPVNRGVPPAVPEGTPPAALSPAQAMHVAQAAFPAARVSRIVLPAKPATPYEVRVRQDGEVRRGPGATRIAIDAWDGAILRVIDPLRAPAGDIFLSWQFPLHSGEAFGVLGRIIISLAGAVPLLLAVTGVFVWLQRWRKRRTGRRQDGRANLGKPDPIRIA